MFFLTETKPKILIALGSPSDLKLLKKVRYDENIALFLSVASAHRTPKAVELHAQSMDWDYVIAGAGFTNALANEYVRLVDCPVIGLPISQGNASADHASFLSSTELPPGYAIAAVQYDGIDAALKAAKYFAGMKEHYVENNEVSAFFATDDKNAHSKAEKTAESLGLKLQTIESLEKDSGLVVAVYDSEKHTRLKHVDFPIIATRMGRGNLLTPDEVLHVGTYNPRNLVVYAAKIIARSNSNVRESLEDYLAGGREKYKHFLFDTPLYEKPKLDPSHIPILITSQEHLEKLAKWEVKK